MYVCFLEISRVFLFIFLFSISFLSLWFCLFMPTENKFYDKADNFNCRKMTSLWDLGRRLGVGDGQGGLLGKREQAEEK